jgi:hypothetical protein
VLRLTYISSSVGLVSETDVSSILAVSRRNNRADRITGMLVYDGRRFLQLLEGETETVERTYARIRKDSRHRAVVSLSQKQVDSRIFGGWDMASQRVALGEPRNDLPAAVGQLVAGIPDPSTRALFESFTQIRSKAA